MDANTTYEIRVQYDNGERARFLQPTHGLAMQTVDVMQALPTTRKVWVNKITIEPMFTWEA